MDSDDKKGCDIREDEKTIGARVGDFSGPQPTQLSVDPAVVSKYEDQLRNGEKVAPIEVSVLSDGREFIAEGHHRFVASQLTGIPVGQRTFNTGGPVGFNWSDVSYEDLSHEMGQQLLENDQDVSVLKGITPQEENEFTEATVAAENGLAPLAQEQALKEQDGSFFNSQDTTHDEEEWRAGREIIRNSRGDIVSEVVVSKEGTYVEILNDPLQRTSAEQVNAPTTTDSRGVLTNQEYKDLQKVADDYQTNLYVIGSRASGEGRRIDQAELPVGKDIDGAITRSDIDVLVDGQAVIDSGGYLADAIKEIGDGTANVRDLPYTSGIPNEKPYLRVGPQLPSQAESVVLVAALSKQEQDDTTSQVPSEEAQIKEEQSAQAGLDQVVSASDVGQTTSLIVVEDSAHTEGSPQQTQGVLTREETQREIASSEEDGAQKKQESTETTATSENRLEVLNQEAAEARALADQKTTELEQAQALADEKAQIAEQTAAAAADRIERLEYSTQLLKDQMEDLPPNEAAVNERICEKNQAEIAELNAEIARTAAETEVAQEIVETILPEQQQAEAAALAAEEALKEEEARRQEEEQKALEEQRALEEAQQAEEAKKAEEAVQQKEEAAELAEQEAHPKAQEAQQAEEIAAQKEEEALEAEEIAQLKAKEAEKAEEIALEKEEEAQKAEEAVKQANEEEQEAKEIQEAEELAKQKAIEAEEARAEADLKAEKAKEAEAVAKQKAEEALEAKEDAALKAEEAQQAEAIAEEKAEEAQKARAELTEEPTSESVEAEEKAVAKELTAKQTEQANEEAKLTEEEQAALAQNVTAQDMTAEEVAAAKEVTASQDEQTSENPQLAKEAALAVAEGVEAEQALQSNVQETAATEGVVEAEQAESSLQDKADFFALDENAEKTAAEMKLEQLEYSSQLLKDEMEDLSPNEAAVYERTYESHQAEIAELKEEIARSATETAQAEQGETALHGEETAGLVASEESATLSQTEAAAQLQTAEANQAVDETVDLSNAVERDASVTTLEAGQENHVADQALSGDTQAELPTSTNLEEGLEGTVQVEDSAVLGQIAQEEPAELATQGDPPVSADKNEVLETVENQADEEEAPSGSQNAGKSSDQEEEPAVQQAVQQTVDDSSRSTTEVETSSSSASSEARQEEKKEDFTIAAAQITSMSVGSGGSAGGGGSSMCFFMPCFHPIFTGWGRKRNHDFLSNFDLM